MIKIIYGNFLLFLKNFFGVDFAKNFDAILRFKRFLNLKEPITLADKVAYIENHLQTSLASKCTDKWEVRQYVKEKGFEEILVPVYESVYDSFEDIPFELLPDKFVLKATHGCKMNFICQDKSKLDLQCAREKINQWLNTVYGAYSCEWHYLNIKPRIYCEKYIEMPEGLIDYKIHCSDGKPLFILTCSNRKTDSRGKMSVELGLYDLNWNRLDGLKPYKSDIPSLTTLPKPNNLEYMLEISKKLSENFKFCRIDLYDINDKVLFGEITFSPAACVFPYMNDNFILEWGGEIKI